MAVISFKKINCIKTMLITYFSNSEPITKSFLSLKVDEDTIAIAVTEGFLVLQNDSYYITKRGKSYRDLPLDEGK